MPNKNKSKPKKKNKAKTSVNNINKTVKAVPVRSTPGISNAPVAVQVNNKTRNPTITNGRNGCTISHREYITDISRANNGFVVDTYNINPGLSGTFPWLAQIATRFESYTFERLNFVYEPMVPTTQVGTVMMAIDFDAADTPPANKTTLLNMQGAMRSAPWQPFRMSSQVVDRKKMVYERYVRSGATTSPTDIKTYDMGNLQVATVGVGSGTVVLGELYVEYTVRLRTPQIQTSPGLSLTRKTTQSGTIRVNSNMNIVSHAASVIGDGPNPLLYVLTNSRIYIHPSLRKFLFSYIGHVNGGSFTGTYENLFVNPKIPNAANSAYWRGPVENVNSFARIGTVQRAPNIPAKPGSNFIVQTFCAVEPDDNIISPTRNTSHYNNFIPMQIRGPSIHNGVDMLIDYIISPIEVELWPLASPNMPELDSTIYLDVVNWPIFTDIIPGRNYDYGINQYTFNAKEYVDKPDVFLHKIK